MKTSPCCRQNGIKCIGINSLSHGQKRKYTSISFIELYKFNIVYYIYCLMIHIELFGLHGTMCERVWSSLIDLSPMEYTIKKLYNHNGL
jgi:hypothetical protein